MMPSLLSSPCFHAACRLHLPRYAAADFAACYDIRDADYVTPTMPPRLRLPRHQYFYYSDVIAAL